MSQGEVADAWKALERVVPGARSNPRTWRALASQVENAIRADERAVPQAGDKDEVGAQLFEAFSRRWMGRNHDWTEARGTEWLNELGALIEHVRTHERRAVQAGGGDEVCAGCGEAVRAADVREGGHVIQGSVPDLCGPVFPPSEAVAHLRSQINERDEEIVKLAYTKSPITLGPTSSALAGALTKAQAELAEAQAGGGLRAALDELLAAMREPDWVKSAPGFDTYSFSDRFAAAVERAVALVATPQGPTDA